MIKITIGRDSNCDIILHDSSQKISRNHAVVYVYADNIIRIKDISTNGTFVNGRRITTNVETIISRTDKISFANITNLDWSKIPYSPVFENSNSDNYKYSNGISSFLKGTSTIILIVSVALFLTNPDIEKASNNFKSNNKYISLMKYINNETPATFFVCRNNYFIFSTYYVKIDYILGQKEIFWGIGIFTKVIPFPKDFGKEFDTNFNKENTDKSIFSSHDECKELF